MGIGVMHVAISTMVCMGMCMGICGHVTHAAISAMVCMRVRSMLSIMARCHPCKVRGVGGFKLFVAWQQRWGLALF